MKIESFTEEQLIDFAKQHGCEDVNHWKLERWHKEDVIPRPVVEHLGHGLGTRSTYPAQTPAQILAVYRLLKSTRKFDVVRFQAWIEGYHIPLPILRETVRQLVPQLRWRVPRREAQKYDAVERRLNILLQKIRGRFFSFLFKRFGKNLEHLHSFVEIQLYLLYGIHIIFEPSHVKNEPSAADILALGFGLEHLRFLPNDLTADFQRFSDKELLSITKMNAALDEATEEDLRRASKRIELVALIFEAFEIMGVLPKLLHSLLRSVSDPSFQAMFLVFSLHLEKNGFADNMDGLLDVLGVQVPRMRAFQTLYLLLQQELPAVADEISPPEKIWRIIKDLSEQEREQYFVRENERLRGIYIHYQPELDAFWQRHSEIKNAFE